jgi:rhodanese-related sulfurtransferase
MVNGGWIMLKWVIRRRFPKVRSLTTQVLADWLQSPEPPLLLDVRTAAEFAVSHLPGALWLDPATPTSLTPMFLQGEPLDTPIALYCSIGYRSAIMGDRLQKAGYTQVVNLAGSIFQWANEGRLVHQGDRVVSTVHPYNRFRGWLLR